MPEHQSSEVHEPGDSEIGKDRCLVAFNSLDTDSDVRPLDHSDVVSAISHGHSDFVCARADH